jgi:predicted DCC family thiol-disulfide oxidoreductase YuxK
MFNDGRHLRIVFDGGCPACKFYFNIQKIKQNGVDVEFVDARSSPELVLKYALLGIDLNDDFVVELDGNIYSGGDAMYVLAGLGHNRTYVRKINAFIFSNSSFANFIYPALRLGRKILLFLIRRKPITS